MNLKYLSAFLLSAVLLFQACGTAHVQPNTTSDNLDQYKTAYISSIKIRSKEKHGDALEANNEIQEYARQKLSNLISESRYKEVTNPTDDASLGFNLGVYIEYGNRAARYFGGFGAGEGTVHLTLEVIDSKTEEIKYSATGASHLRAGGLGGSMGSTIKENIDELLNGYFVVTK